MPFNERDYKGDEHRFRDESIKKKIFIVIFGTRTFAGKLFDIILMVLILLSVLAVMLESVSYINEEYGFFLRILEWVLTILFTIEYIARIAVVLKPEKYIFSWLGIVDLLSIIPTYISFFIIGSQGLVVLRALRLLRVFRVLKLMRFVKESQILANAIVASRHKIIVFFLFVLILVFILGSIMYLVEDASNGFNSIPLSIYWAIVTLTTVGFGDIAPVTVPGRLIASVIMLLGYSIIAIPTGIFGAEIYKEMSQTNSNTSSVICQHCGQEDLHPKSKYCRNCGEKLSEIKNLNN